jgi:hypothetical protein
VYVFHPKNIVLGLAYLLWHGDPNRLSRMQAVQRLDGEPVREIHGLVTWSGEGEAIDEVVEDVFGPLNMFPLNHLAAGTLVDEDEVMRRVGLRFAVVEMDDQERLWWLTASEERLVRSNAHDPKASLQRFIEVQQWPLLKLGTALSDSTVGLM